MDTYRDTPGFALYPRVVPRQWHGELVVESETALQSQWRRVGPAPDTAYRCQIQARARQWVREEGEASGIRKLEVRSDADGRVTLPPLTEHPGEYSVRLIDPEGDRLVAQLGYYVQEDELRGLRPYLGDLHSHSTASDGRWEPLHTVLRARERGYDFLALTDHHCFTSSLETIRLNEEQLGMNMLLLRGEECHQEQGDEADAHFHIVGLGHTRGITDAIRKDPEKRRREIAAITAELRGKYEGPEMDLEAHAHTLWTVRKIHELGGVAIYGHPYWQAGDSFYTFNQERELTFAEAECDGVEVLTDITTEEIMLQLSRAYSEAAGGREWALIGSSDSHNADTQLKYGWTCVLAPELSSDSVLEAIRQRRCVACSGRFEELELFGPFPLMPFAYFYHRRLWPLRRRIMELQSALAFSLRRGGTFDRAVMEGLNADLETLDRRLWAD